MAHEVIRNEVEHQFEIDVDGAQAVLTYREGPHDIVLSHTRVPKALEGHGVGAQLAKTALEYARERHLRVVPSCPFVSHYIRTHPEYQELITGRPKQDAT